MGASDAPKSLYLSRINIRHQENDRSLQNLQRIPNVATERTTESACRTDAALEEVGVDIFTFRNRDFLITVDYLSSYFEIDRLPSKKASDVIYCLKSHFERHGLLLELVSDNNPFNSTEFRAFAQKYDFKHTTSSPHHPQSIGKSEGAVKMAKRLME